MINVLQHFTSTSDQHNHDHHLDMTLGVAEALRNDRPNQTTSHSGGYHMVSQSAYTLQL